MLLPGERRIQTVTELDFPVGGSWSCCACGKDFPAATSRLVHYRHADGRAYRFVVCRDCGEELTPHRIEVDRDRLEVEDELEWLQRRVEEIAARRSMPDRRRLRLRSADVRELAAAIEVTPVTLVQTLAERHVAEPVEERPQG